MTKYKFEFKVPKVSFFNFIKWFLIFIISIYFFGIISWLLILYVFA